MGNILYFNGLPEGVRVLLLGGRVVESGSIGVQCSCGGGPILFAHPPESSGSSLLSDGSELHVVVEGDLPSWASSPLLSVKVDSVLLLDLGGLLAEPCVAEPPGGRGSS